MQAKFRGHILHQFNGYNSIVDIEEKIYFATRDSAYPEVLSYHAVMNISKTFSFTEHLLLTTTL